MSEIGSASRGQPDLQRIIEAVRQRFGITGEYLREEGTVEFNLDQNQREMKSSFLSLIDELKQFGKTAVLRRVEHGYFLVVLHKIPPQRQKMKTPLILLFATLATILADGFVRAYTYSDPVTHKIGLGEEISIAIIYGVSLLGIIGIHEMGHKVASWYHKMDSSWPYFVPGIPGIWPTMGAVISARDPPTNRDSLFDLGLSGPIAGLAITVIVSLFAVASAQIVPVSSFPPNQPFGSADYYTSMLIGVFKPSNQAYVITGPTFTLLYFAYSIGFLLTFINLLPAWQLDGGHIANAALSPRIHRILTYVSIVVMFLIGFYLMAFLILFLSGRAPALEPLDNVSPLSPKRKVFFILTLILAASIFAFVFYNNAFFGIDLNLFKL